VVSGLQELVGSEAVVLTDFNGKGQVIVHGEHWQAVSEVPLKQDQTVRVTGMKHLTLQVTPIETDSATTEEATS
jgi:membrane-bound serine protease (ClpP class)